MKKIQRVGKFYTRIIMRNIGIFIFIGLLSVIFHEQGWLPNKNIYAISQLAYQMILPFMIAYEGGQMLGGTAGGIQAVLAVSGVLVANPSVGFFCGMLMGPLAGWLWKWEERWVIGKWGASMQMLVKNLCMGLTGGVLALLGFYLLSPLLSAAARGISYGVNILVEHRMLGALNVVIEPAKVFFLNNMMEHSVLVPLGMTQAQQTGSSILFLLESNPGPGLGLLCALYYVKREKRSEYASAILAEAAGGIHEVYFSCVWSNLKLLVPLILGGVSGTLCFEILGAGAQSAVSPGSVFTILLMAGKQRTIPVLIGVCVSALVTFAGSLLLLRGKNKKEDSGMKIDRKEEIPIQKGKEIQYIAFVCDGGMGSSAMGAALFRRLLRQEGIADIRVEAFAADLVPAEVDLLICQKDFSRFLPEEIRDKDIYTVESLVGAEEFRGFLEQIKASR